MFDKVDFVPLPSIVPRHSRDDSLVATAAAEPFDSIARKDAVPRSFHSSRCGATGAFLSGPEQGDSAAGASHVVHACAMNDDDVALAMSDGSLCHASLARPKEVLLREGERETWPEWSSWDSTHGAVLQLTYSPKHDALVTLEVTCSRCQQYYPLVNAKEIMAIVKLAWLTCVMTVYNSQAASVAEHGRYVDWSEQRLHLSTTEPTMPYRQSYRLCG